MLSVLLGTPDLQWSRRCLPLGLRESRSLCLLAISTQIWLYRTSKRNRHTTVSSPGSKLWFSRRLLPINVNIGRLQVQNSLGVYLFRFLRIHCIPLCTSNERLFSSPVRSNIQRIRLLYISARSSVFAEPKFEPAEKAKKFGTSSARVRPRCEVSLRFRSFLRRRSFW